MKIRTLAHSKSFSLAAGVVAVVFLSIIAILLASHGTPPSLTVVVRSNVVPTLAPHTHTSADRVSDNSHGLALSSPTVEVPEDMWVTDLEITTENAPQGIIHHMHLVRMEDEGADADAQYPLFAYGQDTPTTIRFPSPTGIFIPKGEKLGIDAVLHNPIPPLGEGGVYKDVVITITLRGVPNGKDRNLPVVFHLPRVFDETTNSGRDATFTVPAGALHETFWSTNNPPDPVGTAHTFVEDGWIVHMGAHSHPWEGAERVDAYLNGARIKTYTSHRTDESIPWSWQTEGGIVLIPVRKGDVLTVSTTYSNPTNKPIVGAMGLMGVFYAPDPHSLIPPPYAFRWTFERWLYSALELINVRVR